MFYGFQLWVKKSSSAVSVIRNSKRVSIIVCIGKPIWMITSKKWKKPTFLPRNSSKSFPFLFAAQSFGPVLYVLFIVNSFHHFGSVEQSVLRTSGGQVKLGAFCAEVITQRRTVKPNVGTDQSFCSFVFGIVLFFFTATIHQ